MTTVRARIADAIARPCRSASDLACVGATADAGADRNDRRALGRQRTPAPCRYRTCGRRRRRSVQRCATGGRRRRRPPTMFLRRGSGGDNDIDDGDSCPARNVSSAAVVRSSSTARYRSWMAIAVRQNGKL